MKRICSWCTKDLGEACMTCGSKELLGPINGVYGCMPCKRMWVEGCERVTHGICGACAAEVKAQHKKRMASPAL
jgi:hypothetical protein